MTMEKRKTKDKKKKKKVSGGLNTKKCNNERWMLLYTFFTKSP